MAMARRTRPGGGRHPPPLAPTVSNFKPRAQWSNSGSSIFLYVNLPGFYRDQIEIKKDERTRTIQIQGQRPLSTQTKARFNETYRVPESCDMTKLNTSFSRGLLTIEFPTLLEDEKPERLIPDQGKTLQRPNQEQNRGSGRNGSSLGHKNPSNEEKQVGTSQEKAAPMVEVKRAMPTGSQEKEGEGSPRLGSKERAKEETVVERKEAAQMDHQKTEQKLEEEDRSTPTVGGSLNPKVRAKEDRVTEKKIDGDIGQNKTGQKLKEGITRTPTIGGSLESKVHAKADKVAERNGDGEIGQKLKEEGKISLRQKKEDKHRKPDVGDGTRRPYKEIATTNQTEPVQKTEERVERIAQGDKKTVEDKVSKEEILKDNTEVAETKKVDSDDPTKIESTRGGEGREKMVEKSLESEIGTDMDPPAEGRRRMDEEEEEESQKYDLPLVNVGAAALVIMAFGAYIFVPLVKLFY